MKFTIITNITHFKKDQLLYSYRPYVHEINIWSKFVDELVIIAPLIDSQKSEIDISYDKQNIKFIAIQKFDILNLKSIFLTIFKIPKILLVIFSAMKDSDHIHLRCPGNVGLIASIVQVFFPSKKKTAKYAGNWDPKAKTPISYKLQKWILSNTFLTKNMSVVVYGNWQNQTKNIKPFFTATYSELEKEEVFPRKIESKIKFIFAGTLSIGKRPLYAIQLIEGLLKKGLMPELTIFGDGNQKIILEEYISDKKLSKYVFIGGNQNFEVIKKAYQESHFVILPSKSEGWPKVIAEGMFWGCVPIATSVSCVPYMLDYGNRGLLLTINLDSDIENLHDLIKDENRYQELSFNGVEWSRKFTLEAFEAEIKLLLQS
jgi:glycosyltransferase involved in cell wall biosynthesis